MDDRKTAIFRADASPEIGGGHVMRCLALADALFETGWACAFACGPVTMKTVPALEDSGHDCLIVEGDDEPAMLARRWDKGAELLIVDHYARGAAFEHACRPWARRIMVIDDLADRTHDCDILLDQTLGRGDSDYRNLVPDSCSLLLGPAYALLRPEFAKLRPGALARRSASVGVERILVSMGATDPHNVSVVVLEGIGLSGLDVEVDVVAGAASPHLATLRSLTHNLPFSVTIHESVNDMADLMARADLAIGGAGSTSWERCCLGLPCLTVVTAANQETIAAELERASAVVSLGRRGGVTPEGVACALMNLAADRSTRARMGSAAAGICDGLGLSRTVEIVAA